MLTFRKVRMLKYSDTVRGRLRVEALFDKEGRRICHNEDLHRAVFLDCVNGVRCDALEQNILLEFRFAMMKAFPHAHVGELFLKVLP